MTGQWRRLHNEELHDLYSSPNIIGVKHKTTPLQAWTGPEGSSRLRFPDFKTIGT
jgi:hypothetical protein